MPAHKFEKYSYTAHTLFNSTKTVDGIHYFMVSAQNSNPDIFYDSNIVSGYSLDNLAPESPQGLSAQSENDAIKLKWKTNIEEDLNNYCVYRSVYPEINIHEMQAIAVVQDTFFLDKDIQSGSTYYYCVTAKDIHENESMKSEEVSESVTSIEAGKDLPKFFQLYQNYPNPFNPETTIRFDLPRAANVSLSIYGSSGFWVHHVPFNTKL